MLLFFFGNKGSLIEVILKVRLDPKQLDSMPNRKNRTSLWGEKDSSIVWSGRAFLCAFTLSFYPLFLPTRQRVSCHSHGLFEDQITCEGVQGLLKNVQLLEQGRGLLLRKIDCGIDGPIGCAAFLVPVLLKVGTDRRATPVCALASSRTSPLEVATAEEKN